MTPLSQRPERVADAPSENWVDRFAPPDWRGFLRLSRADRPIGTWLLLLPCWWGAMLGAMSGGSGLRAALVALACVIGSVVMRGAGCTWNDITDREIDAKVARTRSRPLPSGQVSLRNAYIWLGAQLLVGLVVLLMLGKAAIWLGVLSLLPVAIYPFAKRFTWWPQLFLGIAFNWGALLAYAAVTQSLGAPAILAYLGGIAWTLHYDTIYAHQDAEDDALIGVKSTARLFGTQTGAWLRRFSVAAVLLLAAAVLATNVEGGAMMLGLAGAGAFAWHLRGQIMRFSADNAALCLHLFRSNRDAGLLLALALAMAAALA